MTRLARFLDVNFTGALSACMKQALLSTEQKYRLHCAALLSAQECTIRILGTK